MLLRAGEHLTQLHGRLATQHIGDLAEIVPNTILSAQLINCTLEVKTCADADEGK